MALNVLLVGAELASEGRRQQPGPFYLNHIFSGFSCRAAWSRTMRGNKTRTLYLSKHSSWGRTSFGERLWKEAIPTPCCAILLPLMSPTGLWTGLNICVHLFMTVFQCMMRLTETYPKTLPKPSPSLSFVAHEYATLYILNIFLITQKKNDIAM